MRVVFLFPSLPFLGGVRAKCEVWLKRGRCSSEEMEKREVPPRWLAITISFHYFMEPETDEIVDG
jgi:hypothetical protein